MRRFAVAALACAIAATSLSGGDGDAAKIIAAQSSSRSAAAGSLLANLSSYWKLDEAASSTRNDSAGTNHLTDHGGVGQDSGKLSQAATFDGSTKWLSATSAASLQTGDISFALAGWIYASPLPSVAAHIYTIASKSVNATSVEYVAYVDTDDKLKMQVWNGPLTLNDTIISTGTISSATWTHFVVQRNKDSGFLEMWIDGTAQGPVAISIAPTAAAGDLEVGRYGFTGDRHFGGRLDGLAFWKKKLETSDVAALYNAGSGLDYPF